jgi:pyruvate/2-oxoglutarate dehydrogenase complex dihydrolipoamide dehydrogenase (E3) component
VAVNRARFAEVDRAITDCEEHGLAKLVTVDGKLVGAHLVGAHAGELIHTPALAIRRRLSIGALASMSWVYPTLSEVTRKAAEARYLGLLGGRGARRLLGLLRALKQ